MTKTFSTKTSFEAFLDEHQASGETFPKLSTHTPHDISIAKFQEMISLVLSFDDFDELFLKMDPETNELFLADMNMGGHAPRCRVVKITDDQLFSELPQLLGWYDNFAAKMWGLG